MYTKGDGEGKKYGNGRRSRRRIDRGEGIGKECGKRRRDRKSVQKRDEGGRNVLVL